MVEYLNKVEEHRPADVAALESNEVLAAAIVRWVEIVGEAAANVSDHVRACHPGVPWTDIVAMRNRLIHAYPDVNLDLVWGVIVKDGPRLRSAIEEILGADPNDTD